MDRNEKGFSTFMRESIAYYLKLIKLFFVSLKKMWYLPVIGLVLVAYIWLFAFKSSDGGFEGRAIYPYNYLDKQFYSILFDELEQDVNAKDYKTVSKKLKIESNVAEEILSLNAENSNGTSLSQNPDIEGPIFLSVVFRTKTSSDKVAQSILAYLNNHDYVKEKVSDFLDNTTQKIDFLDKELEMLNSLKKNPSAMELSENSAGNNIAELFELSNTKFKEKEDLEKMLKKKKAVELFSGFSLKKVNSKSSFKKRTIYSIVVLGFMSFLSFLIFWYKNPASFEE